MKDIVEALVADLMAIIVVTDPIAIIVVTDPMIITATGTIMVPIKIVMVVMMHLFPDWVTIFPIDRQVAVGNLQLM